MNKPRRDNLQGMSRRLTEIKGMLDDLRNDLIAVKDEEQESYANLPEGLQMAEQGQASEQAGNWLEEAEGHLDTAIDDDLDGAIDAIDEAVAL